MMKKYNNIFLFIPILSVVYGSQPQGINPLMSQPKKQLGIGTALKPSTPIDFTKVISGGAPVVEELEDTQISQEQDKTLRLSPDQVNQTLNLLKNHSDYSKLQGIATILTRTPTTINFDPTSNTLIANFDNAQSESVILDKTTADLFLNTYNNSVSDKDTDLENTTKNNTVTTPPTTSTQQKTETKPPVPTAISPIPVNTQSNDAVDKKENDAYQEKEKLPSPGYDPRYDDRKPQENSGQHPSGGNSRNPSYDDFNYRDYDHMYPMQGQTVRSGGSNAPMRSGSVGVSPSQQSGFVITKPSNVQSQYATHDQVKKLSPDGKTELNLPTSSTEGFTEESYERTVYLNTEPLFHNRLTEPTRGLKLAPVRETEEDKLTKTDPQAPIALTKKPPVSFLQSLWNTITRPFTTAGQWFVSFFVGK